MIEMKDALFIHEQSVNEYGGAHGIRDNNGLEGALARPFGEYDGEVFYKTPYEQAAAILESIIMNHPFVDGNKRTGFLLAFTILERAGIELTKDLTKAYDFVIKVATGETRFEEAAEWLRSNSTTA